MLKTKWSFRQGKDKEMNNRREKTNDQRINQDIQQEQAMGEKLTRNSQGNPMRKISQEGVLFLL